MMMCKSRVVGTQCELSATGTVGAQCNLHQPRGPHPTHAYLSARAFASRHGSDLRVQAIPAAGTTAEHCQATASVVSLGLPRGLSAKQFARVTAVDPAQAWVNTPEGGWRAYMQSHSSQAGLPLGASLQLGGVTQCRLATVAVHRPTGNETSLQLEFDDCDVAVGVRQVTLAVAVRQESGGKSRLVEWMCSLMDHSACWPAQQEATKDMKLTSTTTTTSTTTMTTAAVPHHISMELSAEYTMLGSGPCESSDSEPAAQHELASTATECAVECLVRNRDVFIPGSSRKCEGFAFSKNDSPHCLVYKRIYGHNTRAEQETLLVGWTCYALGHVSGSTATVAAGRLQGSSQTNGTVTSFISEPRGSKPEHRPRTNVVLDLSSELGSLPHRAVRQRLVPLQTGCYEPLDWISVNPGVQVTLNASAWNLIQRNLPLASVPSTEMDSLVLSEPACIAFDDDILSRTRKAPGHRLWPLIFTALITSAFASVIAAFATCGYPRTQCGKLSHDHWPGFVNTTPDGPDGPGSHDPTYSLLEQGTEEITTNQTKRTKQPVSETEKNELLSPR